MSSFDISTAKQFLVKLHAERDDFTAAHCLSARRALNAIITAYHLHEWVWGECCKQNPALIQQWGLTPKTCAKDFECYCREQCPGIEDARKITNGTKHFHSNRRIKTGSHKGAFQRGAFQDNAFDVSYLWIEGAGGQQQRAEEFIDELITFWDQLFHQYGL